MTSQPGQQRIAIHILSNISRNKGKETLKFGQVKECNKREIFFLKNHVVNETGRQIRDLF